MSLCSPALSSPSTFRSFYLILVARGIKAGTHTTQFIMFWGNIKQNDLPIKKATEGMRKGYCFSLMTSFRHAGSSSSRRVMVVSLHLSIAWQICTCIEGNTNIWVSLTKKPSPFKYHECVTVNVLCLLRTEMKQMWSLLKCLVSRNGKFRFLVIEILQHLLIYFYFQIDGHLVQEDWDHLCFRAAQ